MAGASWRLAGYRIEELLGEGSTGSVWRARVAATGVPVALKRIRLAEPGRRAAALSEAAILSALDHPHLMRLHEVRRADEDAIVLVLDLAAGGSLGALLARRGRLTVGETITAAAPIAAALAYAHQQGIVHGDVSAANVLFTEVGLPLLADLGVARLLGDTAYVRTTPSYADPAVAGGALPGPASDVFMLGAVALHALTGQPAWPGDDPAAVLAAAAAGDEPDFAGRLDRAGVPGPVADVLARALELSPVRRCTAAEPALELRHAAEPVAVELAAGRPAGPSSTGGRAGSWPLQSAAARSATTGTPVRCAGEPPLTYGVRAPAPFPPDRAGRHLAPGRLRVAAGPALGVAVVLAALVAAGIVWWPDGAAQGASTPPAAAPPARPAVATPSAATPSAATPSAATPSAATPSVAEVTALLTSLDAARSAAYAQRAPGLLDPIYASPALLARDRAALVSTVPPGCALHGVRTRFDHVTIAAVAAGRITVRARSALAPSTLVCGQVPAARAPGTAPTAMLIELARVGSRYRIAAQYRSAAATRSS